MISLRSKITQKILAFIFLQNKEFYASGLAKRLELDRGNLIRKLHELEKIGLLKSEFKGHEKYYSINKSFPFLKEYKSIVQKTVGFEEQLRKCIKGTTGVKRAIIFGSYVKDRMDEYSDIDVLVIGEHKVIDLQSKISDLQKNFDREVNVINISSKEFAKKKDEDPFIRRVLASKKVELLQ